MTNKIVNGFLRDDTGALVLAGGTGGTAAAAQLVYNGTSYPARPATDTPQTYVGPSTATPTDMQVGDIWIREQ